MKLLFLLLCASAPLFAQAPNINSISPRAVVPGKSTLLTLYGSNLKHATNLWTSFGPGARQVTNSNNSATYEVPCPEEARGVAAIQAYGPNGVSDFELILIDPLPVADSTSPLNPPSAVDASFTSEKVDRYKLSAKAGQPFSIEILAHRFGSQADPVLRILDAEGHELAYCDDDNSVWRDPRFLFRAPVSGEYQLAVHDVGYGGGNDFFYRLRVGNFPMVCTPFPLCDPAEPGTREPLAPVSHDSPANPERAIWFSALPMLVENEPNETRTHAQPFHPPAILNGRFESGADRDLFQFTAAEDERITFHRQSRSLGSPCDIALRILNADGKQAAESDHRALDETPFTHRFEQAGTYFLEARELTGTAPANAPYRVKVEPWTPRFTLSTETSKLEIKPGETAKLKITCERFDYDGEITLHSPELPLGDQAIPAGKKDFELPIKLPADVSFLHFAVHASASNGYRAKLSTQPALRKTFPLMLTPPPGLDGLIAAGSKQ